MNVGELKQLIKNVPDNYDVTIYMENAVEAIWRDLDLKRTGFLGMIAHLVDPPPEDYRDRRPLHSWAGSARLVMWKGKKFGEFRITNGDECPSLAGKYVQPQEEDESAGQLQRMEKWLPPAKQPYMGSDFKPFPKGVGPQKQSLVERIATRFLTDGKS